VTTYTIHEALIPPRDVGRRANDLVFVKEGFSWWAFLAPLPWLLFQRLWLEALAYLALTIAIYALALNSAAGEAGGNVLFMLLNILLGFEANDLRRWAMERRGRKLVAVVSGTSFNDCERRFFESWLPFAQEDQARRWSNPASNLPPARPASMGTLAAPPASGPLVRTGGDAIIGFPGEGG
jgi:hypothetical protein